MIVDNLVPLVKNPIMLLVFIAVKARSCHVCWSCTGKFPMPIAEAGCARSRTQKDSARRSCAPEHQRPEATQATSFHPPVDTSEPRQIPQWSKGLIGILWITRR
jgi:hypothetical protein